jgi:hypothetical protein
MIRLPFLLAMDRTLILDHNINGINQLSSICLKMIQSNRCDLQLLPLHKRPTCLCEERIWKVSATMDEVASWMSSVNRKLK